MLQSLIAELPHRETVETDLDTPGCIRILLRQPGCVGSLPMPSLRSPRGVPALGEQSAWAVACRR